MTRHLHTLTFTALFVLAAGAVGSMQEPSKPQPAAATAGVEKVVPITPLKVQVVISRYQGEKKISSLPYTLSVNANEGRHINGQYIPSNPVHLRMGAQVPVPMLVAGDVKQGPTGAAPLQYKDIGTNIDCYASTTADGRFNVNLTVEDSSVYTEGQTTQGAPRPNDAPAFRSFRSNSTFVLRDGQSTQFMTASDKISGEVIKIDVTVTVVK